MASCSGVALGHKVFLGEGLTIVAPLSRRASGCSFVCVAKGGAAQRVQLGSSNLMVSKCCLGSCTWGNQNSERDAHQQLDYAFDEAGINFIDTAEVYPITLSQETYGSTERCIGSWLKRRRREDVVLAAKVAGYGPHVTYARGGQTARVNFEQVVASVDASLLRLGTDYVDLLQIHWPDRYIPKFGKVFWDQSQEREAVPIEEQLRALDEVVRAGKVRYVGLSNETPYGLTAFQATARALGLPTIVTLQNALNLLTRNHTIYGLIEACHPNHNNVSLLTYAPLAAGALTGKYRNGPAPGGRLTVFPGYMDRYNSTEQVKAAIGRYCDLADKYGITPAQLALAWVKQQWYVACPIIGATSMEQLKENIGAFDITLSDACLQEIDEIYRQYPDPSWIP